jgi:hypothetical protein
LRGLFPASYACLGAMLFSSGAEWFKMSDLHKIGFNWMTFNQKKTCFLLTRLMPIFFAASLIGCGDFGASSSSNGGTERAQSGPATGRLLDSAVGGVAYAASSGDGITDSAGAFNYVHGDMVEFRLGSLSLGKIPGKAIVTPIELANDSANKLQNLLVLFQSLDSDGNPDNGISIPAAAASAVSGSLDLESEPAVFVTSPELQEATKAAGMTGAVSSPEEAGTHFLSQGLSLLGTHIWVRQDEGSATVIRISATGGGEYLQGEAAPDDPCDANRVCGGNVVSKAGVEYGAASLPEFDTRGFRFKALPEIDTNLQAGLSHPRQTWRIRTNGFELITSDIVTVQREREQKGLFGELFHIAGTLELSSDREPIKTEVRESRFPRMENDPDGIIGAWVSDPDVMKTPTYLFFSNGKFMMLDPVGTSQGKGHDDCGEPGIEFGSYVHDAGSEALSVRGFTYDTNGCAGFSGNEAVSFKLGADGNTATLETNGSPGSILYRVSK